MHHELCLYGKKIQVKYIENVRVRYTTTGKLKRFFQILVAIYITWVCVDIFMQCFWKLTHFIP